MGDSKERLERNDGVPCQSMWQNCSGWEPTRPDISIYCLRERKVNQKVIE